MDDELNYNMQPPRLSESAQRRKATELYARLYDVLSEIHDADADVVTDIYQLIEDSDAMAIHTKVAIRKLMTDLVVHAEF